MTLFLTNVQGNKSFVAFSNLTDSESLTKTWKVSLAFFQFVNVLFARCQQLGLYQGRKLPRTRSKTRELELEVMAPSESHGRYR